MAGKELTLENIQNSFKDIKKHLRWLYDIVNRSIIEGSRIVGSKIPSDKKSRHCDWRKSSRSVWFNGHNKLYEGWLAGVSQYESKQSHSRLPFQRPSNGGSLDDATCQRHKRKAAGVI